MKKLRDKILQILYFILFRMMLCYWFVTRPQYYSVYIGVWHKNEILIIKNSYKSYYTVPCGGIKRKENTAVAAARELYEEVGIDISPGQLAPAARFTIYHEFMYDNVTFFEIRYEHKPTYRIDNREVTWARFLTMTDAKKLRLSPVVKTYLEQKITNGRNFTS